MYWCDDAGKCRDRASVTNGNIATEVGGCDGAVSWPKYTNITNEINCNDTSLYKGKSGMLTCGCIKANSCYDCAGIGRG
jgi:hypothetical protein